MVQRPEQVSYLTSLLQWISNSPCQKTQQQQQEHEQSSHAAPKNASEKHNHHANPRQHLMLPRQLKRHRRGEKRYGRNLPDCDEEEMNQHFLESDVPLS